MPGVQQCTLFISRSCKHYRLFQFLIIVHNKTLLRPYLLQPHKRTCSIVKQLLMQQWTFSQVGKGGQCHEHICKKAYCNDIHKIGQCTHQYFGPYHCQKEQCTEDDHELLQSPITTSFLAFLAVYCEMSSNLLIPSRLLVRFWSQVHYYYPRTIVEPNSYTSFPLKC